MSQESLAEALISSKWRNPFPKTRYTERPGYRLFRPVGRARRHPGRQFPFRHDPTVRHLRFFPGGGRLLFPAYHWNLSSDYPYHYFFVDPVFNAIVASAGGASAMDPSLAGLYRCVRAQRRAAFSAASGAGIRSGRASDGIHQHPQHYEQFLEYHRGVVIRGFCGSTRWFVPETILYAAFTAIANYAQPSLELGFAFKFVRLGLLVLTGCFGLWGFAGGILLFLILLCSTRTLSGKSYLYPLIPSTPGILNALLSGTNWKTAESKQKSRGAPRLFSKRFSVISSPGKFCPARLPSR